MTALRKPALALGLAAAALLTGGADELQPHPLHTIHFARGRSAAVVSEALERGAADTYRFDAKAGQAADIRITSIEHNASFVIYQPPSKISIGEDGIDIDGPRLMGGDKTDPPLDAGAEKHWKGTLPAAGTYYVQIGTDRGNATYRLSVSVR